MRVRVNKPRHHRLAADIELPGSGLRQMADILTRAHRQESPAGNGYSLRTRLVLVHRKDIRVVQDHIGIGALLPCKRKSSHPSKELPPRRVDTHIELVNFGSSLLRWRRR
jgi:hypothetical protein